ncbi:MAG: hypothetical protein KIS92_18755 [Planctomycetota bacterium]|nr:hypothetical protein [Planctomycetota bacterium]
MYLSNSYFYSTRPPDWVYHLVAAGAGLALGLSGTILLRGKAARALSLLVPALLALAGSCVAFAGPKMPETFAWFGMSMGLAGAGAGLLAGFSTKRLGGFVGGIMGGQFGAWAAAGLYVAVKHAKVPFGFVFPLAYAFIAGLTWLAIAGAMRLLKVESPAAKPAPIPAQA